MESLPSSGRDPIAYPSSFPDPFDDPNTKRKCLTYSIYVTEHSALSSAYVDTLKQWADSKWPQWNKLASGVQ